MPNYTFPCHHGFSGMTYVLKRKLGAMHTHTPLASLKLISQLLIISLGKYWYFGLLKLQDNIRIDFEVKS